MISEAFVDLWSKKYQSVSQATPVIRGPEYEAAIQRLGLPRIREGFETQWELEGWLFEVAHRELNDLGYVSFQMLLEIGYWKSPRLLDCILQNAHDGARSVRVITQATIERLRETGDEYFQRCLDLGELHGVGIPFASTLLTVLDPHSFTIIDIRALKTLIANDEIDSHKQKWWELHYGKYVSNVTAIRDRCELQGAQFSLRDIDRALWAANGSTRLPASTPTPSHPDPG